MDINDTLTGFLALWVALDGWKLKLVERIEYGDTWNSVL